MNIKVEISIRFKEARNELGLTQAVLAEKLGTATQTIRDYEAGKSIPGGAVVSGMAKLGVDANWLLTGEGNIFRRGGSRMETPYAVSPPVPLVTGNGLFAGGSTHDTLESTLESFVLVPRYEVSARGGNGYVIHSEQVVDHLAFKADWVRGELGANPSNLVLISAVGESMEPTVRPGDLLLVDRGADRVRKDAIYTISHGGELRVKRIQALFDGGLVIRSDNPAYPPEQLTSEEGATLRIVGEVVWIGRRLR